MHLNHDTFHTKEKKNVSFGAKRLWMPGMVKHLALCLRIIDSLLVTCRVMIQLDWENKSFTSKSDLQSHQVEILLFIGVKEHMSWIYVRAFRFLTYTFLYTVAVLLTEHFSAMCEFLLSNGQYILSELPLSISTATMTMRKLVC